MNNPLPASSALLPRVAPRVLGIVVAVGGFAGLYLGGRFGLLGNTRWLAWFLWPVYSLGAGMLLVLAMDWLFLRRWQRDIDQEGGKWTTQAVAVCEERIRAALSEAHPDDVGWAVASLCDELHARLTLRYLGYVIAAMLLATVGHVMFCLQLDERTAEFPFKRLFLVQGLALAGGLVILFVALACWLTVRRALEDWKAKAYVLVGLESAPTGEWRIAR